MQLRSGASIHHTSPEYKIVEFRKDKQEMQVLPYSQTYFSNDMLICEISAQANASSSLLSLPLEIKEHIYRYVCGDQTIHMYKTTPSCHHDHDPKNTLKHIICQAQVTETQAQKNFDAGDPSKPEFEHSVPANEHRHAACFLPQNDPDSKPHQKIHLAFLRTCRQIYHEAKFIPTRTNTFAFTCPVFLDHFIRRAEKTPLNLHHSIRSLHLDIAYKHPDVEERWIRALKLAAQKLPSLQRLHVAIEQIFCVCWVHQCTFADAAGNPLLEKLRALVLPRLRHATVVVTDENFLCMEDWIPSGGAVAEYDRLRWTLGQKKAWAKETRRCLLGGGRGGLRSTEVGGLSCDELVELNKMEHVEVDA